MLKQVLLTLSYLYLWYTMCFHTKNHQKHSKNPNHWFYHVIWAPELRNSPKNGSLNHDLLNIILQSVRRLMVEVMKNDHFFGTLPFDDLVLTQPQFEAKKVYTWKCINSRQKLSCDKTVCKAIFCVPIGKLYACLAKLFTQLVVAMVVKNIRYELTLPLRITDKPWWRCLKLDGVVSVFLLSPPILS